MIFSRGLRRVIPCCVAFAVYGLLALMYKSEALAPVYYEILRAWGVEPFAFPYLDLGGGLASLDCTRRGFDVITANICDPIDRQFNYGPLWLNLTFLPLYPEDRVFWAVLGNTAFILSFALLPAPQDWGEVVPRTLAGISTAVVFVVERANPDIHFYLLVLLLAMLMARGVCARAFGYVVIWLAAGLKFYPLVLLALALRERFGRFLLLALLTVVLAGLYIAQYQAALVRILPLLPVGNFDGDMFAAQNLPMRLGRVIQVALSPEGYAVPVAVLVGGIILVLLLRRMWRQVGRLLGSPDFSAVLGAMAPYPYMVFLCGSLLVAGCFFAGQNVAYRAIFLLFVLPGLQDLAAVPALRRFGGRVVWVCLFVMWEGAFRLGINVALAALGVEQGSAFLVQLVYWVVREMLWWWLVGVLVAVIVHFAWHSPVRRAVWR